MGYRLETGWAEFGSKDLRQATLTPGILQKGYSVNGRPESGVLKGRKNAAGAGDDGGERNEAVLMQEALLSGC